MTNIIVNIAIYIVLIPLLSEKFAGRSALKSQSAPKVRFFRVPMCMNINKYGSYLLIRDWAG